MTNQQKLVLLVTILASFVAILDGTIVNVALPAIADGVGGGLVTQQWVVNAYLISLGAFILLAGSLSDLFGRKKILTAGLIGFGAASLLCAVAPNALFLILARGLQGVAGALLVPSALALIIGAFRGGAQSRAIGLWTSWTGVAAIIGPLFGGVLVDVGSWRAVFAINVLPIAVNLWLMRRLEQSEATRERTAVDGIGAALCTSGLIALVYALIQQPRYGWTHPLICLPLLGGLSLLGLFVWHERRAGQPMLPLHLFKIRNFSAGNLATTFIYAGLSFSMFLITIFIQQVGHYTALQAGLAMLPISLLLFALSSRFGALAGKYGPRWFMTAGPIIGGLGFLWLLTMDASVDYWTRLLPAMLAFGLGLAITVAPLTAAVLSAIQSSHAGIASAVNNAVARIAGLVATAAAGVVVGERLTVSGFHRGVIVMAALLIVGGIVSAIGIQNRSAKSDAVAPELPA